VEGSVKNDTKEKKSDGSKRRGNPEKEGKKTSGGEKTSRADVGTKNAPAYSESMEAITPHVTEESVLRDTYRLRNDQREVLPMMKGSGIDGTIDIRTSCSRHTKREQKKNVKLPKIKDHGGEGLRKDTTNKKNIHIKKRK